MNDFIKAGFKQCNDPFFKYRKEIIDWEEVEDKDLDLDEIPALLFGTSGVNTGFCIYTGMHYIWFSAENPFEAVEFSNKILSIEPISD